MSETAHQAQQPTLVVPRAEEATLKAARLARAQRARGRKAAEEIAKAAFLAAATNFSKFRRFKRGGMLRNWFTADLADELQEFYKAHQRGERPKLAIEAAPQHGKSWAVRDFISWFHGLHPELKTIYTSYSQDLGEEANADLNRTISLTPIFSKIFPQVRIGLPGLVCNTTHIEFGDADGKPWGGSFRNVTVEGPVNGMGLHLGIIDDPHKGRDEANRKTARDKVWHWLTDDFFPRFDATAGLLLIQTRWHVDDVLGRLLEKFGTYDERNNPDGIRLLRYSALAEDDSQYRKKGEPLFPEFKPLEFLLERKKMMTAASWEAEYQQHPIIAGGGVIPIENLRVLPVFFERSQVLASVRYWDKAGTEEGGKFTAGVLMHKLKDGRFVIEDVVRGQWSALKREQMILAAARDDTRICKNLETWIEQEPGSGGKESAENTLRMLAGYRAYADRVTGKKEIRAEPFVAAVQNKLMWMIAGSHVQPFKDEAEAWPHGTYVDQIDAAAGAFSKLTKPSYNTNYADWL